MSKLFTPYLKLVRIPNSPSLVADILLGYYLTQSGFTFFPFLLLCFSSFFLYGFGMILNDINDKNEDKKLNRPRPLASGDLSQAQAKLFLFLHIVFIIIFSIFLSGQAQITVLFLAILILLYNNRLIREKQKALSFSLMSLCRVFNVFLGASLSTNFVNLFLIFALAFEFFFIFLTCFLSQFEDKKNEFSPLLRSIPIIQFLIFCIIIYIKKDSSLYWTIIIPLIISLHLAWQMKGENLSQSVGKILHSKIIYQGIIILIFKEEFLLFLPFILLFLLSKNLAKKFYSS